MDTTHKIDFSALDSDSDGKELASESEDDQTNYDVESEILPKIPSPVRV